MEPLIVIILGRSGSGKGTQAELVQKKFGLEYIGSGNSLRERVKIQDFSGKKIEQVINSGGFVPTSVIFQIWIEKLENFKKDQADLKGVIFDGSPRKLIEAELLDQAFKWYEWDKNEKIFLVNISEQEAFNRLTKRRICKSCGRLIPYIGHFKNLVDCDACGGKLMVRLDDTEESIKGRLNEFNLNTQPVIDYYKKQGRLIEINGEQSIEKVQEDIIKFLQ